MPRVYQTYDLVTDGATGNPTGMHVAQTSTGIANVITFTPPKSAVAFLIACETNGCRVTLEGTTPDTTHGFPLPAGAVPMLVPIGANASVKAVSQAAANSVVQITFLA